MFSKRLEETVDWGIRSKIQSTGTRFPRTWDNAKHPIEEFRNDSSGIIGPHGQSTDSFRRYHRQRTRCPPFPRDHTVVVEHRGRLKASAIEQNTPLPTFWSFARASTWFGVYAVPVESGNPWSNQSGESWPRCFTGVRSNRLNLHPVSLKKSETGNDNAKPVITLNQDVGHVLD